MIGKQRERSLVGTNGIGEAREDTEVGPTRDSKKHIRGLPTSVCGVDRFDERAKLGTDEPQTPAWDVGMVGMVGMVYENWGLRKVGE